MKRPQKKEYPQILWSFLLLSLLSLGCGNPDLSTKQKLSPSTTSLLRGKDNASGCLKLEPNKLDFGGVQAVCGKSTREVKIIHTGGNACPKTIDVTKLSLSSNPSFRIEKAPLLPVPVTLEKPLSIQLQYKPTEEIGDTGELEVTTSLSGNALLSVPLTGQGIIGNKVREVFKQVDPIRRDIILVIDNSSSMKKHQESLKYNLKRLIYWLDHTNYDYRIMVITTDVTGKDYPAGCARGKTRFITRGTPNASKILMENIDVGTNGSSKEQGLEAAYRALVPPASTSPLCNKGFYRPNAQLRVIIVSDEDDQSPYSTLFYTSFFKQLKGREFHLIGMDVVAGPPSYPKIGGCRTENRFVPATPRYWELAQSLKGAQISLCQRHWGGALTYMPMYVRHKFDFYLSHKPIPESIVVTYYGAIVEKSNADGRGWRYHPQGNYIDFDKGVAPDLGSTFYVDYRPNCLP